nr:hypothetical protein [Propylenella binzhouense]
MRSNKAGRIAGRVSPQLIDAAKARTGIRSDTELVEFALASLAVEDVFASVFKEIRGIVSADLELGA